MKHTPKVMEKRKQSDGSIAFLIRCCGDPSTDHWHAIYLHHSHEHAQVLRNNPQNAGVPILSPQDDAREFIKAELDAVKEQVGRLHHISTSVHDMAQEFIEVD